MISVPPGWHIQSQDYDSAARSAEGTCDKSGAKHSHCGTKGSAAKLWHPGTTLSKDDLLIGFSAYAGLEGVKGIFDCRLQQMVSKWEKGYIVSGL